MAKLEQVLILEPAVELRFKGPFNDVVASNLKLTNPTERRVAFKVKTTAPKKYCVRPNSGFIEPKKVVNVAVMLQPFDYNPNEKNKHKFMVQSMFAPSGEIVNQDAVWRDAKPEDLMDSKLRCVFEMPSDTVQNNNLDTNAVQGEEKTSVSKVMAEPTVKSSPKASNLEAELRKVVDDNKRLKDEINQIRQENAQLKEESLRLRSSRNAAGDASRPGSQYSANITHKDSPQLSSFDDKMAEQPQSPMLYLAVILTIGLLGIFIGKFIV